MFEKFKQSLQNLNMLLRYITLRFENSHEVVFSFFLWVQAKQSTIQSSTPRSVWAMFLSILLKRLCATFVINITLLSDTLNALTARPCK